MAQQGEDRAVLYTAVHIPRGSTAQTYDDGRPGHFEDDLDGFRAQWPEEWTVIAGRRPFSLEQAEALLQSSLEQDGTTVRRVSDYWSRVELFITQPTEDVVSTGAPSGGPYVMLYEPNPDVPGSQELFRDHIAAPAANELVSAGS